MFEIDELAVIEYPQEYHSFYCGERVRILEKMDTCYLVEGEIKQHIVKESDLRKYDPIDEYDDMYCDTCGGTACNC